MSKKIAMLALACVASSWHFCFSNALFKVAREVPTTGVRRLLGSRTRTSYGLEPVCVVDACVDWKQRLRQLMLTDLSIMAARRVNTGRLDYPVDRFLSPREQAEEILAGVEWFRGKCVSPAMREKADDLFNQSFLHMKSTVALARASAQLSLPETDAREERLLVQYKKELLECAAKLVALLEETPGNATVE